MEHAELIEESFVVYLAGAQAWDEAIQILPGESNIDKDGQRIVAYVGELTEEPAFSGNRWADVNIELRTPVSVDADGGIDDALESHKAQSALLEAAIMDTGLVAGLNNASLFVYSVTEKNSFRAQDEFGWTSGWKLRTYSVPN